LNVRKGPILTFNVNARDLGGSGLGW